MELPSKLLENAVNEMSQLPGIGKRTALRLVLHLLKQPAEQTEMLSSALTAMRNDIQYCKECNTISDAEICGICSNASRDKSVICVVEDVRDVMALENTGMFKGVYHVLGGKISPIEGVGPSQLKITSLVEKVKEGNVAEIIFATLKSRVYAQYFQGLVLPQTNKEHLACSLSGYGPQHDQQHDFSVQCRNQRSGTTVEGSLKEGWVEG